ncbi:MAG: hypothetical protein RIF46_01350, partial [Cyclobacteriaceae bacterium]
MSITVACLLILMGCSGGKGSPGYETTKMTLEEQEKANPTSFLQVDVEAWENLIGEAVFEGDIKSKATIAIFKDVQLEFIYKSKTNS